MQGRNILEIPKTSTPILSLDDKENSDQNPDVENQSYPEEVEYSTQLEDLRALLEISHNNEKIAKQTIAENHTIIKSLQEESSQLKRVILKQDQLLKKKTKEIADLQERVNVLETYAVPLSSARSNRTHFFKEMPDKKTEYNPEVMPTITRKNAKQ